MVILDEIARERRALADLFDTFTDQQWQTPSLCGDWTVRQTASHLLMPLVVPKRVFVVGLVKARGNFDVVNDRQTRVFAQRPTAEVSAGLRAQAENRFHPPMFGFEAPITELILHGQDIRRPLGLSAEHSAEALDTALTMLTSPKALRAFVPKRLRLNDGLRFEADDIDFGWGEGAVVRGPAASLAYAMAGRTASLGELTGPGVDVLSGR